MRMRLGSAAFAVALLMAASACGQESDWSKADYGSDDDYVSSASTPDAEPGRAAEPTGAISPALRVVRVPGLISEDELTYANFRIARDGRSLQVDVDIRNSGSLERMIDPDENVARVKNGTNSLRPAVGYVREPAANEVQDWLNLLPGDSATLHVQYSLPEDASAPYSFYYTGAGTMKLLGSFAEEDIARNAEPGQEGRQEEERQAAASALPAADDRSILDAFAEAVNAQLARGPSGLQVPDWTAMGEAAPASYSADLDGRSIGVHLSGGGIDTVNVTESSDAAASVAFRELVRSAILALDSSVNPSEAWNRLAGDLQPSEEQPNIRSAQFDVGCWRLMIVTIDNRQMKATPTMPDSFYSFVMGRQTDG